MKNIRVIVSGAAAATILIGGVAFAQSAAFSSEMGVGAQGTNVTSLQTWLENNGYYNGPITGYYGTLTMGGVETFQTANGISATGYVGPLTLAALNAKASGSTTVTANSSTVAQLEAELNSLLAQIQAIENNTTTTTSVPAGMSTTLQTNEGVSVGATLNASGTSPFTYAISSQPTNGTITSFNTSTGAFTYMPNNNYTGSDTFSYTVSNSSGMSAPMTVTVNVQPNSTTTTSSTPTAQNMSYATSNGVALNEDLAASGSGPYTYTIVSNPSHGSITSFSAANGSFTYIPNSGYTGTDSFTYTVGNGMATSSAYTVNITD